MHRTVRVFGLVTALLVAASASAQQPLNLEIRDGLVNLDANGATVRQILDEWARVGGTRVVNGDRITGQPVTLTLENMPERQALEIILRNVAGYMTAPRATSATPGASMYDRIFVLPTSTAPVGAAANANANGNGNRAVPPRFVRPGDDRADEQAADQPPDVDPGAVFTFPQPGQFPGATGFGQPMAQPQQQPQPTPGNPFAPTPVQPQTMPFGQQPTNGPFVPVQPGGTTPFGTPVQPSATPFGTPITVQPTQNGQPPTVFTFTPQEQLTPTAPAPTGGFGTVTPVPGVVQPPPPQGQRPPGR